MAECRKDVDVPARSQTAFDVDGLLGRFLDTTYAYRFGPRTQRVVIARLHQGNDDHVLSDDCYFPGHLPSALDAGVSLKADIEAGANGVYSVAFRSERFCQAVAIDAPGFIPSDNYFHLSPGIPKVVALRASEASAKLQGYAQAFNSTHSVRLAAPERR